MKTPTVLIIACGLLLLTRAMWAQTLGSTNLLEGSPAGSDSVALAANEGWTATTNASWLHLSAANQSGTGSTNLIFTFDANSGTTRTGTLTIAGQTLTVTQAGPTYTAANPVTLVSSGLNGPNGVAVDGAGNVYIADSGNSAIKEWIAASNTVITLVSSGLNGPDGVAVDGAGNVYIADSGDSAIKEWMAASNTVTTLVPSGLSDPQGVAVDGLGNVYIADYGDYAIKEWLVASNTVITLLPYNAPNPYVGVAVDGAGNVYFTGQNNNGVGEWMAASKSVITLISSGLYYPCAVAVDGSGNVYIADSGNKTIKEWIAASNSVTTLISSEFNYPHGVAVDGSGNVYIADSDYYGPGEYTIQELPRAFVDPTPKTESPAAGSDVLPTVLPATANLTGPLAPGRDSSWLTITGVTNGVVSFGFSADTSVNRTAHITLLGQSIAITQLGPPNYFSLSPTNLVEGSSAGSDSVALAANEGWTATTNAPWLHLSAANQSGTGSTNLIFTFDANPGATRTGTLTIAGQTLTVTQAGPTYTAANPVTLVSSGLSNPRGVAVDGAGNVYIADTQNSAIKEWVAASNSVITLISSGLYYPCAVAVDSAENVYIADTFNNAIKEWVAASNSVTTLVSLGFSLPEGVAVDGLGNVYIGDFGNDAIEKWLPANNTVITLVGYVFNEDNPEGVAVDGSGNVYTVGFNSSSLIEWMAASNSVTTLISYSSVISQPYGVAVDSAGNVYIAATGNNTITKWAAASKTLTTLPSSGLKYAFGVAVDSAENVYIADTLNNAIEELPRAFVDPTAKSEAPGAGSDVLPAVVPATANLTGPFAPVSDSPWLTITGVANGVVSFGFTANQSATNRTAQITLLGQSIAVTQAAVNQPILIGFTMSGNGAFQFSFTNNQGASFTVWTTTNVSLPLTSWTMLGPATNIGSGQYEFTDATATNGGQRFYRVSSP